MEYSTEIPIRTWVIGKVPSPTNSIPTEPPGIGKERERAFTCNQVIETKRTTEKNRRVFALRSLGNNEQRTKNSAVDSSAAMFNYSSVKSSILDGTFSGQKERSDLPFMNSQTIGTRPKIDGCLFSVPIGHYAS